MTPKEKAKDLVENIYEVISSYHEKSLDYFEWGKSIDCALIAVEELLKETEETDGMRVINNPYWMEVRNEIEKL
jgi:hypothetical protein